MAIGSGEMMMPSITPTARSLKSTVGEPIQKTVEAAVRQSEEAITFAQANAKTVKTATAEVPPLVPPSRPIPTETSQPSESDLAAARHQLESMKNAGQGRAEDHAQAELMLNKIAEEMGGKEEKITKSKPNPEHVAASPSTVPKETASSQSSFFSKIKNLAEKLFSAPVVFLQKFFGWMVKG